MPSQSPRFLILDEPLPSSEISRLLGLFTYDYNAPLDRFAPSELPHFISKYTNEYGTRTSASIAVQSQRSESVRAKLEHILSVASSRSASRRYSIESSVIKTYRLHDQDTAFDALMACPDVKRQVEALFRRPKQRTNRVYMIVGLKTLLDASVKKEWGGARSGEASAQLPIGDALNAAGMVGVGAATVGAEWQSSAEATLATEALHEGEQIFAVEYRVVHKRLFPNLCASKSGITFGNIKEWGWGEGVMSAASDSDMEFDSSDEGAQLQKFPPLSKSQVAADGGVLWEASEEV